MKKRLDQVYVSRGGEKLAFALKEFSLYAHEKICLDVGVSTGGFTDVLLQSGAKKVYAVDVGYGQLAWKLRQDPRVVVIERQNFRYLPKEKIPSLIDLAVVDVSFISLKNIFPPLKKFLQNPALIIALIKPQFEATKKDVGKGGIVKDPKIHEEVIAKVKGFGLKEEWDCLGVCVSPIFGVKGNKEFFIVFRSMGTLV